MTGSGDGVPAVRKSNQIFPFLSGLSCYGVSGSEDGNSEAQKKYADTARFLHLSHSIFLYSRLASRWSPRRTCQLVQPHTYVHGCQCSHHTVDTLYLSSGSTLLFSHGRLKVKHLLFEDSSSTSLFFANISVRCSSQVGHQDYSTYKKPIPFVEFGTASGLDGLKDQNLVLLPKETPR